MVALGLRVHFSGQRDDAALHFVFHIVVQPVLNQCSVHVLLNACIQIGVYGLCFFFRTYGNYSDLICDNLRPRERPCHRFGLELVVFTGDLSAEGNDAFVAILTDGDIFEAGLIERFANAVGNIR
jgi:hypothetical protein